MNKFTILFLSLSIASFATISLAQNELIPINDRSDNTTSNKLDCSEIFKTFGQGNAGYRKASLKYHPDKCTKDMCIEKFHEIKQCYGKNVTASSEVISSKMDTQLADKIIALVKPHEANFCRSGATLFGHAIKSSIRVKDGEYCASKLHGALANAVCIGMKGGNLIPAHNDKYLNSSCFDKAQIALGLPTDIAERTEYYVNRLSEELKRADINKLCTFLGSIIGASFNTASCKKIQ